jgi:hypothetical protein
VEAANSAWALQSQAATCNETFQRESVRELEEMKMKKKMKDSRAPSQNSSATLGRSNGVHARNFCRRQTASKA